MEEFTERAIALLRESLRNNPNDGVRLLAEITEIPADHPSVVRIAEALRKKAANA